VVAKTIKYLAAPNTGQRIAAVTSNNPCYLDQS